MAAILASHSCYCRKGELIDCGRKGDGISSSSLSNSPLFSLKFKRRSCKPPERVHGFLVRMQQKESHVKRGMNRRPIEMVPTSEVIKKRAPSINGVEIVNGTKQVVNGASIVKRDAAPAVMRKTKSKELPPIDDLKVLPSDEGFSWADENYNSIQRSIDVWSFVISLRVRVFLDNAKWTYVGGFAEDKQVRFGSIGAFV